MSSQGRLTPNLLFLDMATDVPSPSADEPHAGAPRLTGFLVARVDAQRDGDPVGNVVSED
jgi:hypothetical protein